MSEARPSRIWNPARRTVRAGFLLCGLMAMGGCASVGNPANTPAYGLIGGVAVGGLIGSGSGHTGTGAFIGGTLGNAGGSIISNDSYGRGVSDARLQADIPAIIRSADRFDARLAKDYTSLFRQRAAGDMLRQQMARSQAKARLPEISRWISAMKRCDSVVSDSISRETRYPTGRIGGYLTQRSRIQSRLASLKMHQSWFKHLAS